MKNTPSPNGFKVHVKGLLRKHRSLKREIEAAWDQEIPSEARWPIAWLVLSSLVDDLSEHLPNDLGIAARAVVANRDFEGYLKLGATYASPQKYEDAGGYFSAAVVLSLLKKTLLKDAKLDPEAEAVKRFHIAEMRCRHTNNRFRHYRKFDFSETRPLTNRLRVHEVFHLARRKIQSWLGPLDRERVLADVRHGPGGCVGLKRPFTTPYYKFGVGNYTVSRGAYWHSMRTFPRFDAWVRGLAEEQGLTNDNASIACVPYETRMRLLDHRISIADYNEVTFVDKNAKTKRSIAIEPRLNVALQLSVGSYLKGCLQRAGCDLTDQTRNQQLASVGSVQQDPKDPITLDLEMASDTMAIELVRELLPSDWFEFLDDLRSHQGKLRDERIVWNKFSSMGNGFTFELESLIFYALAQSVSDIHGTTQWFSDTFGPAYKYAYVAVYGDDIIVPAEVSSHLVEVLRFCGFRTNESKSFTHGPFRESCGQDWFAGVNVRPFNFERGLSRMSDLIHLHNGLKWLECNDRPSVDLSSTRELILALLPDVLRHHLVGCRPTIDDAYIWCEPDEAQRSKLVIWDRDHQDWIWPVIRRVAETRQGRKTWRYVQFLYSGTERLLIYEPLTSWGRTNWLLTHYASGGSSSDVVISGGGRGTLGFRG